MNTSKISIIIPTYNVEKYVEKCLDSILNQTYKNIEIIIVDDCSNDRTREIIKKIKTNKIKLIVNDINSGAGFSRNAALKHATGDYILFVDSDDYLEENFIETLYKSLKTNNSDIAICDIFIRYEDKKSMDIRTSACISNVSVENILNIGLSASPCNKLFKKTLLEQYPFAEGMMNEDIPSVLSCIINAKKISYTKDTYYNYLQHKTSIQNKKFSKKRFEIFKSVDITLNRIKHHEKFKEYKDIIICQQIFMMFLYDIPKENNIFKRYVFLRSFYKLSKKYNLKNNVYVSKYIDSQGKKHKYYYRLIFNSNTYGLSFITAILISIYNIIRKVFIKKITFKNITINDLIKLSKKQNKKTNNIKISVIIPNYNYENFIYQRLYSVLSQTEKIYEIIFLDDCSKDKSKEKIEEITKLISPYIKTINIFNETNSGSPFIQWEKGFKNSTGDYIWIAEADDYCDKNLLKELLKPIRKNDSIIISYADTAFIDINGNILMKSVVPEIDIQESGHWNKSYVNKGTDEIMNYSYLNCTIANVSSCLIKKDKYINKIKKSKKYRQVGDWLFYVNIMKYGNIAFSNKVLNYYRVHGNNVSSIMNRKKHLEEIKKIYNYFENEFNLKQKHKKNMHNRIKFLKKVWNIE